MMDTISTARLGLVMPELAAKVEAMAAALKLKGITIRVVQGLRTYAEQDHLFSQKPKVTNARGGYSMHNFGLAVDCVPDKVHGQVWQPDWDGKDIRYAQMVQAGIDQGLVSGATWHSLVDYPHFQMPKLPVTPTDRMRQDLAEYGLGVLWQNTLAGIYDSEEG